MIISFSWLNLCKVWHVFFISSLYSLFFWSIFLCQDNKLGALNRLEAKHCNMKEKHCNMGKVSISYPRRSISLISYHMFGRHKCAHFFFRFSETNQDFISQIEDLCLAAYGDLIFVSVSDRFYNAGWVPVLCWVEFVPPSPFQWKFCCCCI